MTTDDTTVGRIVGEWADQLARGESVHADDAFAQYPDLADKLRPLLSALGAVSAARPDNTRPELPGFRVVREIGRGGMGVVYEAQDESLGRRVAVKVLPPHLLGRPEARARFQIEARTAAGLHHTHVVPVFGVGPNFIVMPFIAGSPPPACTVFPPPRVAALGVKLADALAHAHAHGVLHRDVKPGNVLIDAAGEPWLSDFGLARFETVDAETDPSGFVGTLRYAAPERFRGLSDARSDVYSLGLTLYEWATGRPAFDAPDRVELTKQVHDATPPRPRSLKPALSRDFETVLLKALARDPARRYQTAAAFADDLKRVVEGRPIRAKRIGPAGRLWRWANRHPVIAILSVAVFTSLVGGLGGVYWQWRRAEAGRIEADRAFQDAREAVDECFLTATEHPDLQGPGLAPAKEELLRRARKYYERFLDRRGHDPAVHADVAKARLAVGTAKMAAGQFADALPDLDAALDLYGRLGDDLSAARCQRLRGYSLSLVGRSADAGAANDDALARLEPLSVSDPEVRLEFGRVCAQEGRRRTEAFRNGEAEAVFRRGLDKRLTGPDDPPSRLVQSRLHYGLSIVLKRLNRVTEAGGHVKRMDDLAQGLLALDPNRDDYLEEAGLARKAIGSFALMYIGESKAHGWNHTQGYRDGVVYYRRLYARHPTVFRYHANLAQTLDSLGLSLRLDEKYAESEAAFRESIELWETLAAKPDPKPEVIADLGNARQDYATLLRVLGRFDEARTQYESAIASQQGLVTRYSELPRYREGLAIAKHNFGLLCELERDDEAALRLFGEAIELQRPLRTAEEGNRQLNWNARNYHYSRGMLLWRRGERDKAAADFGLLAEEDHALKRLFLRAFRGESVASEAEVFAPIDTAAVLAMLGTHPKRTAIEKDELLNRAMKRLKAVETQFTNPVTRVEFLTRRELDPLTDRPDFRALRASAEARAAKK